MTATRGPGHFTDHFTDHFIDGRPCPAVEGRSEALIDPATGAELCQVALGGAADVDRAVDAAARAFPAWAETPPGDRALALLRLADRIEAHADELAALEAHNVGKPLALARSELPFCVDNLRFFAGAARCLEGRAAGEYLRDHTSWIRREPLGVVGSIAPWNYPLMMAVWKIAPALAAGNTVVLKPSELTPLTALRLAELSADLLPPGVLNVVLGHGAPVGVALTRHPQVALVSLTGDVNTGKAVARAAADTLKRCHLELGGKAPVLVFADADLAQVVRVLRTASFTNTGQDCTAACRIYVHRDVHQALLRDLVAAAESLKLTQGGAAGDLGPLISARQRERVAGFVTRARAAGHMRVLTGGSAAEGPGFYYHPTVIDGARLEDEIIQREVFGPVVTVSTFADEEEAVALANGVDYGLSASLFTRDLTRALDLSRRLRFGAVWINDHMPLCSEMPHGGFRQSGYGKDLSQYALEAYTEVKHVMARLRG